MNYNFKNLDSQIKFNYREDIYLLAKFHGYQYVSECVFALYNNDKKSVRQTAKVMSVSPETVLYWMRKWNFKRRPRGGNTKNDFLRVSGVVKKILDLKGQMSTRAAAEIIHCAPSTIQTIWREGRV